jgi:beta-lactamase class D
MKCFNKSPISLTLSWCLLLWCFLPGTTQAQTSCTIVVRASDRAVVYKDGSSDLRNSPASTFKIPLALMGFDSGLLTNQTTPIWPYRKEYPTWAESWKKAVNPTTWQSDSVVWFSLILTQKLGKPRLQSYVTAFDYGNRDLSSGHSYRGIPEAYAYWVDASLQISPKEQTTFLCKMLNGQLPISKSALQTTVAIIPTFRLPNGWLVHGKTGTGYQPKDGNAGKHQFGWFVGWVNQSNVDFVFARLIKDSKELPTKAGVRARDSLLIDLPHWVR